MQEQSRTVRPVVGVVGGSGGVGASAFAAVLADTAGESAGGSTLVDLDVDGGGIDVLLGIEAVPGARWSGLRLAGGDLPPEVLRGGLPAWGRCAVLGADVASLDPDAVGQVIDSASTGGTVVLDLPRRACPEREVALRRCDLVVLLTRADVSGLVAAHAVASGLSAAAALGALVRPGEFGSRAAARSVGVDLLGELPRRRPGGRRFDPGRAPRSVHRLARALLAGVPVADRPPADRSGRPEREPPGEATASRQNPGGRICGAAARPARAERRVA